MQNHHVCAPNTIKSRAAQAIVQTMIHRVICIFSLLKLLIIDKYSAFTKVINDCQSKIMSPFNQSSLWIERQIQTIGKMIKIIWQDEEKCCHCTQLLQLMPRILLHYQYYQDFHHELVFVCKPPDVLNKAFPPLEQFVSSTINYLQLLKEKAELIASILIDYKTQMAQDKILNTSMYQTVETFSEI